MQKIPAIAYLMLLFLLLGVQCVAQTTDSLVSRQDSLLALRQWMRNEILQQLQQNNAWQKIQQNKLRAALKDSAAIDTLSRLVMVQMHQLGNTGISSVKPVVMEAVASNKKLFQQQFMQSLQTKEMSDIFSQFTSILHQPVLQWKSGSVSITGQIAPSLFNTGSVFINTNMLNSSWAVLGIPMALQFSRQDFTGSEYHSRNIFSFKFDREAWLHSLRDKVKLKINASDLLPDYNDALQKIKNESLGRLTSSLDSINAAYKGFLRTQLAQLGDPEALLKGDIGALRDKLLSADFLRNIGDQKNQLALLQQQLDAGGTPDMVLYDSLSQSVQCITGVNSIISKINSFKDDIRKTGLLDRLQQAAQFKNNSLQQWLQEPDRLKSLAKDQLDLGGLQKIFLNINQLQIGMNTVSLSPLTVYQYTNNGINAEFVNNKTYLFFLAGKQKEFANLYDNRFAISSFSADNTAMGIRVGRGDLQSSHAHFSLFSYQQQKSSYGTGLLSVVPGKTVVATFSNQIKMNGFNFLNLEISKSTHKYDNQKNISDTLLQGRGLSNQLLSGENFMQQLAFTLQWNGEIKDRQLSYAFHGTRIGKGYANPGSLFLSRGMTEFGGSVKKSFFKNQLQLSARGNYREYAYSTGSTSWLIYNFSFQGKWKLKKGQWIALRYQPYQSLKLQNDKTAAVGGSNRLAVDMNIRRRFGKLNYQQVIGLAALKNNYRFDGVPANNNSILLSAMQTFTINKKSYYLNTQYNKAATPSAFAVFNTQFTIDAGIAYNIGKRISATTALNYNSTKDWYKQIGFKQGFSGQLGEKFIVSFYTDILKNIRAYRPVKMDNVRLDWSLQYLIK